jgi:sulfofructose kinase
LIGTIGDDAMVKKFFEFLHKKAWILQVFSIGSSPTAGSVIVASKEHSARAISTRQPVIQAPSMMLLRN